MSECLRSTANRIIASKIEKIQTLRRELQLLITELMRLQNEKECLALSKACLEELLKLDEQLEEKLKNIKQSEM